MANDKLYRARVARHLFEYLEEGYAIANGLENEAYLSDEDRLMLLERYRAKADASAAEALGPLFQVITERDAYLEACDVLGKRVRRLEQRMADLTAEDRGEVWFWQNDDDNDLDSLTCPVQIRADSLQQIMDALRSMLEVFGPGDDEELAGWGPGEVEAVQQARFALRNS